MSGEGAYTDLSEIKPKEGAVAKMIKGNIVTEKIGGIKERESLSETSSEYYKLVVDKIKALALFDHPKGEKGYIEILFTLYSNGRIKGEPKITLQPTQI